MALWMLRHMAAARVDGIGIVDVRGRNDSFTRIISQALHLVRDHDPRRYKRIVRHIAWIVNEFCHSQGLEYNSRTRIVSFEFPEFEGLDENLLIALCACGLVHEATHGVISSRGILYEGDNRSGIESLCMIEQNRFVKRLAQADPVRYPIELLHIEFNETDWKPGWTTNRLKKAVHLISRALTS